MSMMHGDKAWIAVHRRPEHSASIQNNFAEVFSALAEIDEPLPTNVVVPDTVVMTYTGWKWYTFSPQLRKVICKSATHCTTERIIEFFSAATARSDGTVANDEDIVASFSQDRRDNKGILTAVEYFTAETLSAFFYQGERRKLGVLQKFVYPKPYRLADNINSELLLHWNPVESVSLERRICRYALDRPNTHPTIRATVNPAVQVLGKVSAYTLPFVPSDSKTASEELEGDEVFEHHAATLCDYIATALESRRTVSAAKEGRGVCSMTLNCKFSRYGGFLYLLSVCNLRLPADHSNAELIIELVPHSVPAGDVRPTSSPLPGPVVGELDMHPQPNYDAVHAQVSRSSRPQTAKRDSLDSREGADLHLNERDIDEDHHNLSAGARQNLFTSRGYESPYRQRSDAPKRYECPNCLELFLPEEMVSVTFKAILKTMKKSAKETREELERIMPPAKPKAARPHRHGDPLPKRPKSARTAASIASVLAVPDDAECFNSEQRWADIPPVLKRLNVNAAELAKKPAWLARTTALCEECANLYGGPASAAEEQEQLQQSGTPRGVTQEQQGEATARQGLTTPSTAAEKRPQSARSRGVLDSTGIADRLVHTELQKFHRKLRRIDREKQEMRDVVEEVRGGSPTFHTEETDLATIRHCYDTMSESASKPIPGSSPDVTLSAMLQNELLVAMNNICTKTISESHEAVPKKVPTGFRKAFPLPSTLMELQCLDPVTVQKEREAQSGVIVGRGITYKTLGGGAQTLSFSRLNVKEQALLVDVVGADRDRPMDDDETYEQEDE